jgi:hypothetical protein
LCDSPADKDFESAVDTVDETVENEVKIPAAIT